MKSYLFARLGESSTWAALAVLGGVFGIDPAKIQTIGGAATAIAGVAAILIPEKKAA
jgi:hypothetical protein